MCAFMQTLFHMHISAALCHGDLSRGNLMLEPQRYHTYDTVRFVDLGFAQRFNPGKHAGLTWIWLENLSLRCAPLCQKISGCHAWWMECNITWLFWR